ncbi:hypothetical protein J2X11_002026 [Aeromicrobium panaciterrae]|uniref:Peptidase MA-like domain-containing protein n=1 Tax=Aeromicrobium panaciterrae TaxID=363861 RepID=A0ABU1UPT4_9ACTN|nr:hypothetical protein [Aeromicrobium panaciterrae]MDR7087187.1 hypothetical protein [Aeromicrobium panaciterrae]
MADQRRLSPNVTAALVLVLLGAALLLWQRPWEGSSEPDAVVEVPANASALLTQQFRELSDATSESEFIAAAGASSAARTFARDAWSARDALGARDVDLRYITGGEVADRADGSTQAEVEVSWMAGGDSGLAEERRTATVKFRLDPQADETFAVRSVTASAGSLPIWLAGKVDVHKQAETTVIAVDGGVAGQIDAMTARARAAVVDVIPDVTRKVVVVSPHTQDQMAQLVGRKVDDIKQIAAVTTNLDGSNGSACGIVIVLNPAVFATMDDRAAQVVVTHEATHLLTSAVGTSAETWVVEGFADFVALHDDDASLSLSAGQVLAEVKAGKTPRRLPSSADFASSGHGLGASYEAAWMIFRMLGETHSDADIVAFYEDVLGGTKLSRALEKSFGLTVDQLTTDWRRYLVKSASTVS